jgi:hypothetical protein
MKSVLLSLLIAASLVSSAHGEEAKKKGGGLGFTQVPMLTVFTDANGAHHGTLSVDMGLYATDPKLGDQIKLYLPRLTDAYVSTLQTYASALNSRSLADTDYISAQLQADTNRILGRAGARVLLGSVLIN